MGFFIRVAHRSGTDNPEATFERPKIDKCAKMMSRLSKRQYEAYRNLFVFLFSIKIAGSRSVGDVATAKQVHYIQNRLSPA